MTQPRESSQGGGGRPSKAVAKDHHALPGLQPHLRLLQRPLKPMITDPLRVSRPRPPPAVEERDYPCQRHQKRIHMCVCVCVCVCVCGCTYASALHFLRTTHLSTYSHSHTHCYTKTSEVRIRKLGRGCILSASEYYFRNSRVMYSAIAVTDECVVLSLEYQALREMEDRAPLCAMHLHKLISSSLVRTCVRARSCCCSCCEPTGALGFSALVIYIYNYLTTSSESLVGSLRLFFKLLVHDLVA